MQKIFKRILTYDILSPHYASLQIPLKFTWIENFWNLEDWIERRQN